MGKHEVEHVLALLTRFPAAVPSLFSLFSFNKLLASGDPPHELLGCSASSFLFWQQCLALLSFLWWGSPSRHYACSWLCSFA